MTQTAPNAYPRFKTLEGRARYIAAYDAALAHWPAPHEALHLLTRLGSTHVIASGPPDAPPLILLPSFAGTALAWRPNIAALIAHYRTYAVDVIGQPGKSLASRRIRGRRDYAGWLADLMDALGVTRAPIVGASFGGFLAVNQALLTPQRVERVVLIGPAGVFVGFSWKAALAMRTGPLRRRIRRLLGDKRPPNAARVIHRGTAPLHPEDAAWRTLMSVTMAESAQVSITAATVFTRAQLRSLRPPTLLLIGEHEQLYAPEPTLERARARLPGLKGAVIKNADHIAAMAQPSEVNERVLEFLGGRG